MNGPQERIREGWSYCGEVWTDAHGRAVVVLPPFVRTHRAGFHYELAALDAECMARVVEQVEADRFVVATDEPRVKVAWRVTALRAIGESRQSGQEESQA